jgi:transcriptional regulator with XRE-family HTH domain
MARRILFIVAVLVLMVPAVAIMSRIERFFGVQAVAAVTAIAAGGAWLAHTDRSRIVADLLRRAFSRGGLSIKEAAAMMGCSFSQLSEGLNGSEQLSFSRLAALPDAVLVDVGLALVAEFGHDRLQLVERPVADLVRTVERQNELLAALVNVKPRMLKVEPAAALSEEVA